MKVERGHVCNINLVHFVDGLHQAFFSLRPFYVRGGAIGDYIFCVLDRSVVCFTNRISWTGCPRSHICSYRCTKRKEGSSAKEGTGEKGRCMIVLACISSILFTMHLHDKTSFVMPTRLRAPRFLSSFFPIDRTNTDTILLWYIIRLATRTRVLQLTPREHSTDSNGQRFAHGLPNPAPRPKRVL